MPEKVFIDMRGLWLEQGDDLFDVTVAFFDQQSNELEAYTWRDVTLKDAMRLARVKYQAVKRREEIKRGIRLPRDSDDRRRLPGF
jgi:hypothetical protein